VCSLVDVPIATHANLAKENKRFHLEIGVLRENEAVNDRMKKDLVFPKRRIWLCVYVIRDRAASFIAIGIAIKSV
jgi:hypothetical protein